MKYFFIFVPLLTVVAAQQPTLSCNYHLNGGIYGCDITFNNPNGFNNFTEIGGTHLEGFTNADVNLLYRVSGVSTNLPNIICNTFTNLVRIVLYNAGLTEITDGAFSGCSKVTDLILFENRIGSISSNAFVNLPDIEYINLEGNLLTTLPENVFVNQANLSTLNMNVNPFEDIPAYTFRPLENLQFLYLAYTNITAINNQWFTSNARLNDLYLGNNRIVVSLDSFVGLESLAILNLAYNAINEIPAGAFAPLTNLQSLYLNGNSLTELQADSFPELENLTDLDISQNPIGVIHDGAFRGLDTLETLYLSSCSIRRLHSNSFEGLRSLAIIYLNFNDIEDLPYNVFVPMPSLNYIGLWYNRLKTIHRNRFGTLTSLQTLDLEGNIINALDRTIIDDAVNLNTLYFDGNLCASNYFGNFLISRAQYMPMLQTCFSNIRYIVDTITEGDNEFSFFEGLDPGIAFRVNTLNEVQIALTPFNFIWRPTIEIFIGTTNNTRSVIRMNQETNVVTIPTPNIIRKDQWNDFRVTWANQVILVYSGNDSFPFMSFTMKDFFPVNFYGIRAVETRASWSVQPFQ